MMLFCLIVSIIFNVVLFIVAVLFLLGGISYKEKLQKQQGLPPGVADAQQRAMKVAYDSTRRQLSALNDKWGALVDRINDLGGEQFLRTAKMPADLPAPFSDDELRKLIKLCHPDHHNGEAIMQSITGKLLAMRK